MKNSQHRGFTLIELLIVVAVLGILAALAIPSYGRYMVNTRRIDAVTFLQEVAGEQFRFFTENNRYATKMSELGFGGADTAESNEGYYNLSITNPTAVTYVLTATPIAGKAQADDAECTSFTLDSSNVKDVTGSGDVETCW